MPKFDTNKLKAIPEVKPPKNNVVSILSRLKEENVGNTNEKKIKISFEFFEGKNKLFSLGNIESEWFTDLIDELTELSKITKKQIFGEYKKSTSPIHILIVLIF